MPEMSHSPETSVDTLRRRARRRLLGAVVLALCAAVALPLVFEKEPPPLPDEVDIRIPPIDKTPFEPKPIAGKLDTKPANKPDTVAAPSVAVAPAPAVEAKAEGKPDAAAPTPKAVSTEAKAEPKKETKPEVKADAKVDAKAEPRAESKLDTKAETKPAGADATTANADPDGPKTEPKAGDFVVQLVAVRDANSAKEVLEKARNLGYKTAYRERIDVTNGVVTRVRTGPYKDKAFAEKTKDKLVAQGFDAVVVAIK